MANPKRITKNKTIEDLANVPYKTLVKRIEAHARDSYANLISDGRDYEWSLRSNQRHAEIKVAYILNYCEYSSVQRQELSQLIDLSDELQGDVLQRGWLAAADRKRNRLRT